MLESDRRSRPVPVRALVLSLAALAVPVAWALFFPVQAGEEVGLLLWLTALVPAYLFTYYRGWEGAGLALAAGMALLASVQVFLLVAGFPAPDWRVLLVVVLVYLVVSLGIGFVRELLHQERREAYRVALTDPLTRLPNRRQARVFLDAGFASAQRGTPLSLVLFGVDDFDGVVERFGPSAGDDLLRLVADVLMDNSRQTDLTARWGDRTFLTVLANSDSEGAVSFTSRVRQALADAPDRWGRISLTAGIATYASGMASPELLLAAADRALHRAGAGGRDRIEVAGAESAPVADPPTRRSPPPERGREQHAERILVVHGDEDTRRRVTRSLEDRGYSVLESGSGEDALETLERTGGRVDLVLTDIILDGMSGFTLVDRIQSRQGRIGVLYASEYPHGDASWDGVPGSRPDFLQTPTSGEDLGSRVREMLDAAGGSGSSSAPTASPP